MPKLQEFIDKNILEGKTDIEIANAIISGKEAPEMSGSEVVEAISAYKKLMEAQDALNSSKAKDDEKEAKLKMAETVKSEVAEKLKSIQFDPTGRKYDIQRELKRFNEKTGKIEVVEGSVSEAYGTFNNLIKSIGIKDTKSEGSISKEIESDNNTKYAIIDGTKATPSVSDVGNRGGLSIPTEVNDKIMQVIYDQSQVYSLVNKVIVRYLSKVFPLLYGLSVGYIADQSTAVAEKNATFANPTITMHRLGGYTTISNLFLEQKGYDLSGAIIDGFGSEFAMFMDLHILAGCVTGNSDKVDGIIFDSNTKLPSAVAMDSITKDTLTTIKNTLSPKVNLKNCAWLVNRMMADKIGFLENTAGQAYFPGYIEGRMPAPLGIPLVVNSQIPSTLDVSGDNRTTGTNDVIVLADMSKIMVGLSQETRIDTSEHAFFTDDLFAIRAIKTFGQKVLSSEGTAGIVAVAQKVTN